MKKIILAIFILLQTNIAQSQIIEVIDAIGSKLLPKITESVKDIITANVSSRKQPDVEKKVNEAITTAKNDLLNSLNIEIGNIENINNLHSVTRKMAITVGGLKILVDRNIIISLGDASNVKKQAALLFVENLNEVLEDRAKIEAIKITTTSAELRNNLKISIENIDKALGRLKTTLSFSGNNLKFDSENVNNFIASMDRSTQHINDLATAIDSTSRLIESYLEIYLNSFKTLKSQIEKP